MSQRCYECGRETPSYTSPLQHFDGCVLHEPRAQSSRLSTPAAGEDAEMQDVKRYRPIIRPPQQANAHPTARLRGDTAGEWVRYSDYRQLQARNAEQVQVTARIANEAAMNRLRAEAAESKLSALLDGIEGLEAKWRGHSVINLQSATDAEIARAVNFTLCRDELLALREKANG